MKRLSDYTLVNGCWEDPDGVCVGSTQSAVMDDILGFCGCGNPDVALKWVRDALMLATERSPADPFDGKEACKAFDVWCADIESRRRAFFGSRGAELFFLYWLDREGLTEHGGGVDASWLSESGAALLEDLNVVLALKEERP